MYYDLLARFSAMVEYLAPRLLRVQVAIAAAALLIIGGAFSWLLAAVAILALFLFVLLWMADRWTRRKAGLP